MARLLDHSVEHPVVEVAGSRIALPAERRFGDLAAVQRYADAVLALDWVRERWPAAHRAVRVRERRGPSRAHYERTGAVIALPVAGRGTRWALREVVVVHELSHHLGPGDDPLHGPSFAGRMLELLDGLVGPEAALLLRVCFGDQGVTWA